MKFETYEKTTTLDENGELKEETTKQKIKIPQEEDYVKIYLKHLSYINNLPIGLNPLIYELFKLVNYNNQIIINSSLKRQIAERLGKGFNSINQYITKLVNKKILLREDKGIYYLNPIFFGKGKYKDILELRKKLELRIEYKEDEYIITHNLN